jgi:hypothetical protein
MTIRLAPTHCSLNFPADIAKLHHPKQIQILWITNATIPDALSPDNQNLAAAILAAIDRFTED